MTLNDAVLMMTYFDFLAIPVFLTIMSLTYVFDVYVTEMEPRWAEWGLWKYCLTMYAHAILYAYLIYGGLWFLLSLIYHIIK